MNFRSLLRISAAFSVLLVGCDFTSSTGFSPYAPLTVSAVGGIGSATVEWDASKGTKDSASIRYTAFAVQNPSRRCSTVGALTCVITGLTNETSYTFTVTASGPGGTSPRAKASVAVTPSTVAGVNWQKQVSGTGDNLEGVVWTGTRLVAVGGGYSGGQLHATIARSTDGVTWGAPTWISTGRLYSVAWTGSMLVAVGGTGARGLILTSTDGLAWTERTVPTPASPYLRKVVWGDNRLVAVGDNGKVVTSLDGMTWTSVTPTGATAFYLASVVWTGTRWVASGWKTSPNYQGALMTSEDGLSWTKSTHGGVTEPLVWSGNKLLAGGFWDTTWSSTDGLTWTASTTGVTGVLDAAWMAPSATVVTGQFLVIATGGETFATSPDGLSWINRPINPRGYGYGSFNSLAIMPDKLVIVGESGDIRISP